ncbi:hypothetical protein V1512DRAFT_258321 [Lipomyces arxii]|uniref:uncharacterized protein n=1 Tax=Lipomyces arxii TaxID=56418 RepID=UPI0034CFB72B
MDRLMSGHDVRRRLLRGFVSSPGVAQQSGMSPVNQDPTTETPTGRGRGPVPSSSSVPEELFYGPARSHRLVQTPDNLVAQSSLAGQKMRRRLPQRGRHLPGKHSSRTSSPALESSPTFEGANMLEYRSDIVLRDPISGEPKIPILQTEVALSDELQEREAMEYRIRRHLRNAYGDIKQQLDDQKLQLLVTRDLKRIVQSLDEDAWMYEPVQESTSDNV